MANTRSPAASWSWRTWRCAMAGWPTCASAETFLEPPEALEAINRGLTGMPADAGELELALAVQSALPSDAEMFGFSAEAVAVTLRRALA